MRFIRYILFAVLLVAVVMAAMVFRSRPQYQGELDMLAVSQDTEVLFDSYGIPHIYAENGPDAYMALGYVHAQERLFQMELLRRAGGGRLAEVLGPELVEVDKLFRTMGVARKAKQEAERLRSAGGEVLTLSQAYLKGVNTYIHEGRLPLEFKVIGMGREEFTIEDMYCIAGAMSLNFAQGMKTDPLMSYVKDNLGPAYLDALQVSPPENNENVPVYPDRIEDPSPASFPSTATQALQQYLGLSLPTFYGSNTWAIAPWKTEDGVTLLANDTHIGYAQPCTWYEAHLEYPGHRSYGNYMAGIPFALTGHNAHSAWGVTMLLNDDMDLYCEELDADHTRYRFMDTWKDVEFFHDTIQVKGQDPVHHVSSWTHHGPLVTDHIQVVDSIESLSLRWTFVERPCHLLEAFYELNLAADMDEARNAVARIAAPGLNISYADKQGNIALWAAAHLPLRGPHTDPHFLLDGVSGQDEILDYRPFEENPSLENPPWGFIYSCNNQHDAYFDMEPEPGYYEPDQRATRVMQKLDARNDWSMEAMKRLTMDDHSQHHEDLCNDLVYFLKNQRPSFDDLEVEAVEQLGEWDGGHHVEEVAPSIYYRWLYAILKGAMEDEMGEQAFTEFLKTNVVKESFSRFICAEENPWWNNISDKERQERKDIILKAFRSTIQVLRQAHGEDITKWTWGETHKTTHFHAFKDLPVLGDWLSVGPYAAPGAIETVNNSVFYLSDDPVIQSQYGPQMRRVINLNDIENSQSILPTGQSGMRMSPHYDDQAEMYIKGTFRPQLMNRTKIERNSQRLLFIAGE